MDRNKEQIPYSALFTAATWQWAGLASSAITTPEGAQGIFRVVRGYNDLYRLLNPDSYQLHEMLLHRHTVINRLIRNAGHPRIIEVAAGFSPRGCEFSRNPAIDYHEVDLRQVVRRKREQLLSSADGRAVLLRSNYQLKHWDEVSNYAEMLLAAANISTDDQIIAHFYRGKAMQEAKDYANAIAEFKTVAGMTKSETGAEARYSIADSYLQQNDLEAAEKAGFDVIKNTPSYEYWVAKSYILLGDVYARQQDYFNAKATFQSIVTNSTIPELKQEAKEKLEKAEADEKAAGKKPKKQ